MAALKIVIQILFILICIALTVLVLMQEGKSAGLGAISGAAETYWGKNKGRSMEGKLVKITKYLAIGFMLFSIIISFTSATIQQSIINSVAISSPVKLFAVNNITRYRISSSIFARGSILRITEFPGKYCPIVMSFIIYLLKRASKAALPPFQQYRCRCRCLCRFQAAQPLPQP